MSSECSCYQCSYCRSVNAVLIVSVVTTRSDDEEVNAVLVVSVLFQCLSPPCVA